ncbi:hypothetical protein P4K96_01130 [Bacillus cereus]|nr:hypothetical protein [Paenibacillus dendritiformis]MEB9892203.1 hypothetical protein [Bacillus cereus]
MKPEAAGAAERIRVYFQGYACEKKQAGRQTRRVLATPQRI